MAKFKLVQEWQSNKIKAFVILKEGDVVMYMPDHTYSQKEAIAEFEKLTDPKYYVTLKEVEV